jgi:hypothetical protein
VSSSGRRRLQIQFVSSELVASVLEISPRHLVVLDVANKHHVYPIWALDVLVNDMLSCRLVKKIERVK